MRNSKWKLRIENVKHGLITVAVAALLMACASGAYAIEEEVSVHETLPAEWIITAPITIEPVATPNLTPKLTRTAAPIVSPQPEPKIVERYASVTMTEKELRDFAAVIFLEARNQSPEGQQAVAEVVLNRVIADNFPDTVHDVLFQGARKEPQFSTIGRVDAIDPMQEQYDAITAALYGPSILPDDVVYFSRRGENSRVWGKIEDHVFCRQYIWR